MKSEEQIFDTIQYDLKQFGQHNPAPTSFSLGKGKDFRHYELGSCFGLVAYNEGHVFIVEIKEDDDNWFCFNDTDKNYYDSAHLKTKIELYQRMNEWLLENFERGYYSGQEGVAGFECGFTKFKS